MPDWSKIGKRSRGKGQRFERKIAKLLSKATGLNWRRTPASGGMEWKGDVICTDLSPHEQPFVVECKDRGIKFDREYLNGYPYLIEWAEQNKVEDKSVRMYVVFTTNNGIVMVFDGWNHHISSVQRFLESAELETRKHKRRIEDGKTSNNRVRRSVQGDVSRNHSTRTKTGKRGPANRGRLVGRCSPDDDSTV